MDLNELAEIRLISRPYNEQAGEFDALLRTAGVEQKTGDHVLSDQDLLSLLEANLGAALMPETARGGNNLRGVAVDGLDLAQARVALCRGGTRAISRGHRPDEALAGRRLVGGVAICREDKETVMMRFVLKSFKRRDDV